MNKITRKSIADSITMAGLRCDAAHASYKPYQPNLDHEAALKHLADAHLYIDEAKEKILSAILPKEDSQPQLQQAPVMRWEAAIDNLPDGHYLVRFEMKPLSGDIVNFYRSVNRVDGKWIISNGEYITHCAKIEPPTIA